MKHWKKFEESKDSFDGISLESRDGAGCILTILAGTDGVLFENGVECHIDRLMSHYQAIETLEEAIQWLKMEGTG